MIPTDKRFHSDDSSRFNLHLRLIVQFEFITLDRMPQLFAEDHPLLGLLVEFEDMEAELIAAAALRSIEGEIGLHHHGVDTRNITAVGDDADAGAGRHLIAIYCEGSGEDFADLRRQRL